MKPNPFLIACLCLAVSISACKKDSETTPATIDPVVYPNFSQLKVGNYWVYEQFLIDTNGNATTLNRFDSCYVEKDTIINGMTYYKVVKPKPPHNSVYEFLYQRDSLDYIVNAEGEILFSSNDFSTEFTSWYYITLPSDTLCHIAKKMTDKDMVITIPAGTFTTSNAKETYYMYPNYSGWGAERARHNRYAVNIGPVVETAPFYVNDPNYLERRLARYHIN